MVVRNGEERVGWLKERGRGEEGVSVDELVCASSIVGNQLSLKPFPPPQTN